MAVRYKLPRGTRAALNTLAGNGQLEVGQAYLITDESRIAVALTIGTYEVFAKLSEAGSGGGGTATGKMELKLAANVTSASTTVVNITGLEWIPNANTEYHVRGRLFVQSGATAAGIQVGLAARTGYDSFAVKVQVPNAVGTSITAYSISLTNAFKAAPAASPVANVSLLAEIDGLISTGASPSAFTLTLNSETSATVTMLAGSVLEFMEVTAT